MQTSSLLRYGKCDSQLPVAGSSATVLVQNDSESLGEDTKAKVAQGQGARTKKKKRVT
jgi:hypothetical protein